MQPGVYLAILIVALIVAVWFVLQIIGFLFKLIFLALVVLIAVAAYRAWRGAATSGP